MRSSTTALAVGLLAAVLTAGCTGAPGPAATRPTSAPAADQSPEPSPSATRPATPSTAPAPAPGTRPPPWLGTRVLPTTGGGFGEVRRTPPSLRNRRFTLPDSVRALPGHGFAARVWTPAPRSVIARSTWRPGCPVGPAQLSWIRLTFWGFDDRRHTGELLVHTAVAQDLVQVFRRLYALRFPMEAMTIVTRAGLNAPPTGDGNGTGVFACRPTTGGTSYSQHAYGLAIDVNSFQNPYVNDGLVLPELAGAYLRRDRLRPGMIRADGPVVRAFASIGWEWGGAWSTLKDYQHFSLNGR